MANMLCAYATMGREPGSAVMRVLAVLEGRVEAVTGTFKRRKHAVWLRVYYPFFEPPRKKVD